jgi:hypothetical protein
MRSSIRLLAIALVLAFTTCTTTEDLSELTEGTARKALTELAAADSIYLALRDSQGMPAAAEAALTYLQSYEGTEMAGVSPDSSVWVLFRNGLEAFVYEPPLEGLAAMPPEPAPEPVRTGGGGEAVARVVAVLPFAWEFGSEAEEATIGMLDTCFGGTEPATEVYRDAQVTVSAVEEILSAGPGVLFWVGHGGMATDPSTGTQMSCLLLGESYPTAEMASRVARNYAGRLKPGGCQLVIGEHKGRHFLAITPYFVYAYARFDYMEGLGVNTTKSLAFICACHSAGQCPDPITAAFEACGVDACLGWDWSVSVDFARSTHRDLFAHATDTCSISQAFGALTSVTDPSVFAGKNATLRLSGEADADVMIRAQMKFKHGGDVHGYSVGVTAHDGTSIACVAGDPLQEPKYSVVVNFPGSGPGSWNCAGDEDAEMVVTEITSARSYFVSKGLKGVSGTITAERYDGSTLSGRFSGTLGWWQPPHDPHDVPPDAEFEIQDGVFKQTGIRY